MGKNFVCKIFAVNENKAREIKGNTAQPKGVQKGRH
jgi:hypothetical protein